MKGLFEKSGSLSNQFECFIYDSTESEFPVKPHWHYFAELIYMLEGSAEMHAGDDVYIISEGDFIIFHPSEVHSIYGAGDTPPKYAVLKFDINRFGLTPAYAPKLRDIFRHARRKSMNICFRGEAAEKLDCESIFRRCMSEVSECRYGRDLVLQLAAYELMMNIIRSWLDDGMVIDIRNIVHVEDYEIENITEYIDRNMYDNIRVEEIAEHCNLSYSCFARKFREQYGMSCKQYIERMRICKAEEFLLFTDFDLNYISQETGFSDCSHLIRSFRKYRGVTPKQFRMNRRGTGSEKINGGARYE